MTALRGMRSTAIAILCVAFCLAAPWSAAADKAPVLDTTGARVTLAPPASRIVSLSRGGTESLFAMGSGAKLVAIGDNCDYPEEARKAKAIPVVADRDAVLDAIIAERPDLVVLSPLPHPSLGILLRAKGIAVFMWDPLDFVAVARAIMALGVLSGREESAIKVAATLTQAVRKIRLVTDALHQELRPDVVWLAPGDVPAFYGVASLASAMIEAAGGRNARREKTPRVEGGGLPQADSVSLLIAAEGEGRAWWKPRPSELVGDIFTLLPGLSTDAGPRLPLGLLMLAKRLHPAIFP